MESVFTIIRQNRKALHRYIENTSIEDLCKIPKGFNNNIWWNIAHVVVTEQKLIYGLSGLPLGLSENLVADYQKGTFPKGQPSEEDYKRISELLFSLPEKTTEDYKAGIFTSFKPYMTTPKVPLNSVDDALLFNMFHEGLHLGAIFALEKAIKL